MKKVLSIFIMLAMLSSIVVLPAAAAETVALTVSNVTAQPGEEVTVTISVANNTGLASLVFDVAYDSVLTLTNVTFNPAFGAYATAPTPYRNPEPITMISPLSDITTNGIFVTLTFKVSEKAAFGYQANVTVMFNADDIYDGNFDTVPMSVINGAVTVACPHANTVETPEEPADCDSVGYTTGVYCNDCKTYISGHEEIPATNNHVDADGKWEADENAHFRTCECGVTYDRAPHSGGSANCTQKAKCEVCGQEYGKLNEEQHGQTEIRDAVEATATKPGYTGDIYCKECGDLVATGEEIAAVSNLSVRAVGNISYTISGRTVTVSHKLACKLGYLSNGSYVAIPTVANGDGSYSFDVPENVTEVLLVVKGDVNGDGKISSSDYSRLNAVLLKKTALTVEATFAADCNVDGKISSSDYSRLNAVLLQKTMLVW